MAKRRFTVPAVVASDGSGTFYTPVFSGFVESIRYVKTDYADTVDFAITVESTTESVWSELNVTAAVIKHPRAATHATDGTASVYVAAGSAVLDYVAVGSDRLKFAITNGGTSTTGSFTVTVSD